MKINKSQIFRNAWDIAKAAAVNFNDKAKVFFPEALKEIWDEAKNLTAASCLQRKIFIDLYMDKFTGKSTYRAARLVYITSNPEIPEDFKKLKYTRKAHIRHPLNSYYEYIITAPVLFVSWAEYDAKEKVFIFTKDGFLTLKTRHGLVWKTESVVFCDPENFFRTQKY